MEYKTILLNSEEEFREYVVQNFSSISKILVAEDPLDNVTYFYCFTTNQELVAAKSILFSTIK